MYSQDYLPIHSVNAELYVCVLAGIGTSLPNVQEKKEEILLSPMTNARTPTEKSKKQHDNIKNATKNFDYTTIADQLRMVSWSNSSHSTGVAKPVNERSTPSH